MSKGTTNPLNREAAARIIRTQAQTTGGKTPPDTFGTRVDRVLQKQEAARKKPSP